jgi:hypothetical protein
MGIVAFSGLSKEIIHVDVDSDGQLVHIKCCECWC